MEEKLSQKPGGQEKDFTKKKHVEGVNLIERIVLGKSEIRLRRCC